MRAKKIGQPHLGYYRTPHTATQNIHTQKKRAEKERQLKKANSIKQRKAILALNCTSDNLYSVSSAEKAQS